MNSDSTPLAASDSASLLVGADVVARMMGVSQRTVWRLLSAGKLIEPLRIGGSTRWRADELRQWIADGCPNGDCSSPNN